MCTVALLLLASCKKDEVKVVANPANAKPGTLTASATNVPLAKADLSKVAVAFSSTGANFGYSAAVTSTLQIAVKGTSFATKKEYVLTGKNVSLSFTQADFNNMLLALNLPTGQAAQVEARMQYSISNNVAPIYSNVVTLTATPFALVSYVYVPGAYQGWTPATADSLKSATGNGVYTGIINFTGSDLSFKITSDKKGSTWYGILNGALSSSGSATNITAPGNGQYLVTVDLNANTITMAPATAYYSLIGDATTGGWGADTDMKYDNGNDIWTVTTTLSSSGAFKVRKNHDWGTSYGTIAAPDGKTLTSANGGNIPVAATGTYTVTFSVDAADASKATYTMTKK